MSWIWRTSKRDRGTASPNGLRMEPGATLLNGFDGTPFAGRLIACRPDERRLQVNPSATDLAALRHYSP